MTISITRTALYLANIYQVFGYKSGIDGIARSLKHHRWPFDIRQEQVFSQLATNTMGSAPIPAAINTVNSENTAANALVTWFLACWISDYSVSYSSDTAMVQETVTINVSDLASSMSVLNSETFASSDGGDPYSILNTDMAKSKKLTSSLA